MGVFHVFKIAQMVTNGATHPIISRKSIIDVWQGPEYTFTRPKYDSTERCECVCNLALKRSSKIHSKSFWKEDHPIMHFSFI